MRSKTKSLTIFTLIMAFVAMISFATINLKVNTAVADAADKPKASVSVLAPLTLTQEEHDYMCWPSGDDTIDRPLQIVMNFKAQETLEEAKAGKYINYLCDFYLEFGGLANGSIIADGCYLAGNYGDFGWIVIPVDGLELEDDTLYPVVSGYDATLNYKDICGSVKDFTAAIYVAPEILTANPNFTVTLSLRMTNPDNADDVLVIGEPATYNAVSLGLSANVPEVKENGLASEENTAVIESAKQELIALGVSETNLANATTTVDVTVESLPDASGKIVYNVAPMLTAGDKSVKISEFNAPVTFRLPVLSNETKTVANVYHEEELMGVYDIEESNGSKYVEVSSKLFSTYAVEPVSCAKVSSLDELDDAIADDNITQIAITDTITIHDNTTLDFDGKTVTPASEFTGVSAFMVGDSGWGYNKNIEINVKNATFTGFTNSHGVLRVQGVVANIDNCKFVENTQTSESFGVVNYNFASGSVTNCVFEKNTCVEVIDFNSQPEDGYVASEDESFAVSGCEFNSNKVTSTGVIYYAKGAGVAIANNEFTKNEVKSSSHAAVLYYSDGTGCSIKNNVFTENDVKAGSVRSGILILEPGITVTENAFVNNAVSSTATGTTYVATVLNKGDENSTPIDLSGNYWGGNEPDVASVKGAESVIDSYYTTFENGTFGGEVGTKEPSGKVSYRAYVNDSSSREAVGVDLENVYATESFVVELYDANGNILTRTTLKAGAVNAANYTANIVLWGNASSSWDTEILAEKLTVANYPAVIKVYADGVLVDTYENALGVNTNVNQLANYQALDCVYKAAKVGNTYYSTLEDAIENADGKTVVLLSDIALDKTLNIKNKAITLDLNGKVLSGTCNSSQAHLIMVENTATLTIKDSGVDGKITYAQGSSNVGWTIDLEGALILESGTIELTGSSWSIGYAVDVRPNAWGTVYDNPTVFTMNGGSIVSSDGAVRVASSSADTYSNITATFIMNDGMIDAGWDGIFIQQSNATYDVLTFTMNGGSIESAFAPIRVYGSAPTDYVNGQDCMNITLNGGSISYTGDDKTWVIDGVICVGGGMTVDMIVDNGNVVVSETVVENLSTPDGYAWVETTDGVYELVEVNYVAEVNGVKYATLQDAINAANGETITLIADVELDAGLVIASGKIVTIDLNGKVISYEDASNKAAYLITNYGKLTVIDSAIGGKITMNSTTPDASYGYAITTIANAGEFTLESGIIENTTVGGASYAIDVIWYTKDVSTTINGGEIIANNTAIRQTLYSATAKNALTINGGVINGGRGVQVFNYTSYACPSDIVINGGEINATYALLTSYGDKEGAKNTNIEITDGTFNGYIYVYNGVAGSIDYPFTMNVSGGTFNSGYYAFAMGETTSDYVYLPTISGGTFKVDVYYNVADGFEVKDNGDGTFGIEVAKVAEVNGVGYVTLQGAIDAANAGDTVTLLDNIQLDKVLTISKEVTLELNGKVISGICNSNQGHLIMVTNSGKLTIKDSVGNGKITYAQGSSNTGWTIDLEGALVLESGTIELTGSSWMIGYAVDVRPNAWGTAYTNPTIFTMNGGSIVSSDGGVRVASSSADNYKNVSASFVMNGGELTAGWDGVFIQQSNAVWDKLNFTIEGGKITSAKYTVRYYAPVPTSYVDGEDCVDINLNGGEISSTATDVNWLVEGIICVGGGITAEQCVNGVDVTASETFAQANVAEGYEWNEQGKLVEKAKGEDKFIKTNLYLADEISMNFYATLSDATVNSENAYVVLTWNGSTKTIYIKDAERQVQGDVTYYVFHVELLAHQMALDVTAKVVVDGEETATYTQSVKAYSEYIIAHPETYTQKDIALMVSVLNYGAAAQVLGGYTDVLANAGLSDEQKALVANADEDAIKAIKPVSNVGTIDGATVTNFALILEGKVGIRVYINLNDGEDIADYTATVNGQKAEIKFANGRYYVDRLDIYASDLSMDEVFVITKGEQSITFTCTALNYAKSVLLYDGSTTAMKDLAKALYLYSVQADAYN